jgi:hypothetical protein
MHRTRGPGGPSGPGGRIRNGKNALGPLRAYTTLLESAGSPVHFFLMSTAHTEWYYANSEQTVNTAMSRDLFETRKDSQEK